MGILFLAEPGASDPISGASTADTTFASLYTQNAVTVTVGGTAKAEGYIPCNSAPGNLWTRDNAYTMWHNPGLKSATKRREWVTYWLSRRTVGTESDPDGGTLPANFIADRISSAGSAVYKNAGASKLPFMDGIAFVVLALWTDWNLTGDTTTFTASSAAIDACLGAIPRSASGCVYSDPSTPSVDYGFTDTVKKTGDVAYGTGLQAWAYKMCAEMNGESGSGKYTTLRNEAQTGLATLRNANGYYKGSSSNNSAVDDVWVTALAVAENLTTSQSDRMASARKLRDDYLAGTITQKGYVRHLPVGQYWSNTTTSQNYYQNGAYWPTPVWDCVRAVALVDRRVARNWAAEALTEINAEIAASAGTASPYEWIYGATKGEVGYTPHAAITKRFV